jgi:trehalose utilization protein
MLKVTIYNEGVHEKKEAAIAEIYPEGIHGQLKKVLSDEFDVTTYTLETVNEITTEVLNNTDVLLWWGHMAHSEVKDELVERVKNRVYNDGMGFLPIHSAHHSKPFRAILGTTGNLAWGRDQKAIVWNLNPTHPIAAGIPQHFELFEELYAEPFFIPKPDDLIFGTWYEDGNIFRGGCTLTRGLGKIF